MRTIATLLLCHLLAGVVFSQTTIIDFEDKTLPGPNTFYNGSDNAGGFTSRGAFFNNQYTDFGGGFTGWDGFAYSNVVNTTTAGFGNQYAAYHLPTGGGDGSSNYGIAFSQNYAGTDVVPSFARVMLPAGTQPMSMRITTTTYSALSMLNGDSFAKKFGGATGDDPDFLLLNIQGRDVSNAITGTVSFYLADYRFSNNALDYIVSQWTTVDLSGLGGNTVALTLEITTSDVGEFGGNTPAYFALDNLMVAIPEPGTVVLMGGAVLVAGGWQWRRRKSQRSRQIRGMTSTNRKRRTV